MMGAITINLPDDLEKKFRELTMNKFGDKQGRLSKGAIEAFQEWCNEELINIEVNNYE